MEPYEAERDYSLSEELTAVIRISPDKHSRLVMNLRLGTMLSDFPLPLSLAIYENSNEAPQFGKGCTLSHFLSFADYESSSPVLTDFFGEKYYYPQLFCPKNGTKLIKEGNLLAIEDEDKNRIEYENGKMLPIRVSMNGSVKRTFSYQGGRLSSVNIDGTTMNYRYDSYGRRTEKYSDGYSVRYIYRGGLLIGMRTGTKKIRFEYTCESRLFSMTVV